MYVPRAMKILKAQNFVAQGSTWSIDAQIKIKKCVHLTFGQKSGGEFEDFFPNKFCKPKQHSFVT